MVNKLIKNPTKTLTLDGQTCLAGRQSMQGLFLRSSRKLSGGIKRATGIIGLINLTYNLFRGVYPERSRREQVLRLNII